MRSRSRFSHSAGRQQYTHPQRAWCRHVVPFVCPALLPLPSSCYLLVTVLFTLHIS